MKSVLTFKLAVQWDACILKTARLKQELVNKWLWFLSIKSAYESLFWSSGKRTHACLNGGLKTINKNLKLLGKAGNKSAVFIFIIYFHLCWKPESFDLLIAYLENRLRWLACSGQLAHHCHLCHRAPSQTNLEIWWLCPKTT